MEIKDIFFNACRVNFDFLITEYGYQKVEESEDRRIYEYIFTNGITRIQISFNEVSEHLAVTLIRLIDGTIPRHLLFEPREGFDYISNAFNVIAVLEIRHPEGIEEFEDFGELYSEQEKEKWAEYYRKLGWEVPEMNNRRKKIMITPERLEHRLKRYAHYLIAYASDILQGDFSLFPQLQEILESRRRKHAEERKQIEEQRAKAKAEKEANGG